MLRLLAVLAVVLPCAALADAGLAIICTDAAAEGTTISARACATQKYDHPQSADLVRYDSAAVVGGIADWSRTTFVWRRWEQLSAGDLYEVCTTDIVPGSPNSPSSGCADWRFAAKGGTPGSPTVQVGDQTLTWNHPTTNTDGSPLALSDIANTAILRAAGCTTAEVLAGVMTLVPAPANSVTLQGVPEGTWCYGARTAAVNGNMSALSNIATATVDVPDPEPEPEPEPQPAAAFTSTRIESADWTCRDSSGAVLSSHQRQDKAMEACANRALAEPGAVFEIRPSGYRIVAQ